MSEFLEEFEKRMDALQKAREIHCPYCNTKQDEEVKMHFVTYWGDDGEKECRCEHCDEKFVVDEQVERTFLCFKKGEDKDELH